MGGVAYAADEKSISPTLTSLRECITSGIGLIPEDAPYKIAFHRDRISAVFDYLKHYDGEYSKIKEFQALLPTLQKKVGDAGLNSRLTLEELHLLAGIAQELGSGNVWGRGVLSIPTMPTEFLNKVINESQYNTAHGSMMPRGKQGFIGSKVILEDFKSAQEKLRNGDLYLTEKEYKAIKQYAAEIGEDKIGGVVGRMRWG